MSDLYYPIPPHQTRLLYLPRDASAGPEDVIKCSLYVVDILHPDFDGFGLRTEGGKGDQMVQFNALSYVWGSPEKTASMVCNGLNVAITQNLHDALTVIRTYDFGTDFLWVDQVCINQSDEQEKAVQVQHMLMFYERAMNTVAWLGDPKEHLEAVMMAVTWDLPESDKQEEPSEDASSVDLMHVAIGAQWIYSTPWFKRLWVQQEIFASRSLRFLCGSFEFKACPLLSPQSLFSRLPKSGIEVPTRSGIIFRRKPTKETHYKIKAEFERLATVIPHGLQYLQCYSHFSKGRRTDIVECMLRMRDVQATDPRDFVYGVLGISRFPSRPMSIETWAKVKDRESFLPIDYNIDIRTLWCILSRILLLQAGLSLLAKFKVNYRNELDRKQLNLPSWAIDWRLTAQIFQRVPGSPEQDVNLDNVWDYAASAYVSDSGYVLKPRSGAKVPAPHLMFCNDNTKRAQHDFTKLRLQGKTINRSHVYITEHMVEIRQFRGKSYAGKAYPAKWHVTASVHQDDIVVFIDACSGGHLVNKQFPGLWLLRPVSSDEFELIACLPCYSHESDPLEPDTFPMWELNDAKVAVDSGLTPIMATKSTTFFWIKHNLGLLGPISTFIIV